MGPAAAPQQQCLALAPIFPVFPGLHDEPVSHRDRAPPHPRPHLGRAAPQRQQVTPRPGRDGGRRALDVPDVAGPLGRVLVAREGGARGDVQPERGAAEDVVGSLGLVRGHLVAGLEDAGEAEVAVLSGQAPGFVLLFGEEERGVAGARERGGSGVRDC